MFTKEIAIDISKHYLNECLNACINIEKAILFGSIAKNNQKENSDIDLALVSKDFSNNFLKNNKITSSIQINYPDLEIHHFNSEYFIIEYNKL